MGACHGTGRKKSIPPVAAQSSMDGESTYGSGHLTASGLDLLPTTPMSASDVPSSVHILEALPDVVLIVNAMDVIEFANRQVAILGFSPTDLVGKDLSSLIPCTATTDLATFCSPDGLAPTAGPSGRHVQVICADRSSVPMRLSISKHQDKFFGVLADVRSYMVQATQREQDFHSYMMHECRNYLQAAHGALEVMGDATSLDEIHAWLPTAAAGTGNVLTVFDRFSVVTRLDSDSFDYHMDWFLPTALTSSLADMAAHLRVPQHVQVATNLSALELSGHEFYGDVTLLRQSISTLLDNAAQFARQKISVSGSIERIDSTHVRLHVIVSDDGPGVTPDRKDAIFEKYKRLRTGSDANRGGSGLGLYIARKFARAHAGDVELRSPQSPTSFTIWVELSCRPLATPALAGRPAISASGLDVDTIPNIVIADDVKANCLLFQTIIKSVLPNEAHIRVAYDGAQTRAAVNALRPMFCFIDEEMPDERGSDVIRYIRTISPSTIVVSVTGSTDEETHHRIRSAGADRVLIKPIGRADFVHIFQAFPPFTATSISPSPAITSTAVSPASLTDSSLSDGQ